jgi:hypothetical protein
MAFNDIFTVLKKGPLPSDEEIGKIPGFMFCRFLGGHPVTILAANEFNKFHKEIPLENQYKMIKQIFAGKGIFPKMLKKIPKEDHLDSLCKHYKISREKAKEYRTFLSDAEFEAINKIYEIKG